MSENNKKRKIIISGGGTGGHIYPAIAISQEFIRRNPAGKIIYIGKKGGREEEVVAKTGLGIQFQGISAQGFPRRISPALFTAVYRTMVGFQQAYKIVKANQPEVVIGTGGYVSATAVLSAQLLGIPTLIHEQNAFPGITNRLLGKKARIIASSYEGLSRYFPESKIRITGNPVRAEFKQMNRNEGLNHFGLSPDKFTILVFGGSQGAMAINKAFIQSLEILDKKNGNIQVIIQTGEKGYEEIREKANNIQSIKVIVKPYLFQIDYAYACADLVISRAGAISLSEITLCGLPSILIPYPYATGNHQEMNARAIEKNGAAMVILEKDLTPELLVTNIEKILNNDDLRKKLSEKSRSMAKPNAAEQICDLIESLMDKKPNG